MLKQVTKVFLAMNVASLAGGMTTTNTSTYSGDVEAAIKDDAGAAKEAGEKAGTYVRISLTSPMPDWELADSPYEDDSLPGTKAAKGTSATSEYGVDSDTSPGVQVFTLDLNNVPHKTQLSAEPNNQQVSHGSGH